MVFSLVEYEKLVFLDADMLVFRNMDELFDIEMPGPDWIAAVHSCVCNDDKVSWAHDVSIDDGCAFDGLTHPEALKHPNPVPTTEQIKQGQGKKTYTLFNSGLFVFTPYQELWDSMITYFNTTPLLTTFLFADNDFFAEYFRDKWMSVGYQYNATKTVRAWHPQMWRDDEVRNLHYVADKPWTGRIGTDEKAGKSEKDRVTHRWWWDEFGRWEAEREKMGEVEVLDMIRANVARPLV
jgi:inositol 3-alpha-galactosyltransferase